MELPPRARRIPDKTSKNRVFPGTTSACAENTAPDLMFYAHLRNYLRVRGEYLEGKTITESLAELPPRARRIREYPYTGVHASGTTSACAENTHSIRLGYRSRGNYLRVRGEYMFREAKVSGIEELPPRARRIPQHH